MSNCCSVVHPQLRIIAYDSANPGQRATSLVTISVTRNENGPIFGRSAYNVAVPESLELGAFVIQVNASDMDGVSGPHHVLYLLRG